MVKQCKQPTVLPNNTEFWVICNAFRLLLRLNTIHQSIADTIVSFCTIWLILLFHYLSHSLKWNIVYLKNGLRPLTVRAIITQSLLDLHCVVLWTEARIAPWLLWDTVLIVSLIGMNGLKSNLSCHAVFVMLFRIMLISNTSIAFMGCVARWSYYPQPKLGLSDLRLRNSENNAHYRPLASNRLHDLNTYTRFSACSSISDSMKGW